MIWLSLSTTAVAQGSDPLTAAWIGQIDQGNLKVTGLPSNARVIQLRSGIVTAAVDSFRITAANGAFLDPHALLATGQKIELSLTAGGKKVYTLETGPAMPETSLSDTVGNLQSFRNRIIRIGGKTTLRLDTVVNPLYGSFLDLGSEDVWLYFDQIMPSRFRDLYLDHIVVNGNRAKIDTNIRVVQYREGCVVISQPSTYQPLEVFTGMDLTGSSMKLDCYTYYRAPELGTFHDAIASFRLKKGYMATFAQDEKGTGHSKVYIASERDTVVSLLPDSLRGRISFVRVFPWRWVGKKGWTNTVEMADTLRAKWTYNWNNNRTSTIDAEYVPIRQTRWWPSFATTNAMRNTNHLLGFNEPDNPQQADAYCTVDQAIGAWQPLLESGLRIGSPATTDGGLSYLYAFMDKADSAGLRVDFVAVHFYRGCQTAAQYYNFLRGIHERTGRPLWVTEFNNGANWTTSPGCPLPTYAQQAATIQSFLHMLDTAAFVERYCLYEWVESTRQLFNSTNPIVLNPAGKIYRDQAPPLAYQPLKAYEPYPAKHARPFSKNNLAVLRFGNEAYATANANPMFIDEYTPLGVWVQSIPIPAVKSVRNLPLVSSAGPRSNSDGMLSLSPDGKFLALAGYNTITGSASTNSATATAVPRGVAIVDSNGQVNTQSSFHDLVSQHVVRGAVVNNGDLYMTGGSTGGMRYASFGKGTAAASTPLFSTPGTTRKVLITDDDVYFSQNGTGWPKINKLTGTPVAATTPAGLSGIPQATTGSAVNGFVLFDMSDAIPGMDLLYYVDETPDPVLNKYINDGSQWLYRGRYNFTGMNESVIRDLTGSLVDDAPVLYGVSFSGIVRLADMAAHYTDSINILPTVLVNKPVNANAAFRGIAFTPGTISVVRRVVTGIQDLYAGTEAVIAYPNPAADLVQIHVSRLQPAAQITIFDALGRRLKTERLTSQIQQIDLSALQPGLLLVRVQNGRNVNTLSVLKR